MYSWKDGKGSNMNGPMMNPWMMTDLYSAWESSKGQWKGKSNGKGKGKGKGSGGKGKGKGDRPNVPPPPSDYLCRCCGKPGHSKKDCRNKDQCCNNCGKTGHLKNVCTATKKAPANDQEEDKQGKKKAEEAQKVEWQCTQCHDFNPDENLFKCKRAGCQGRSPKSCWQGQKTEPTGITKNSKRLVDEGDPEKLQEEVNAIEKTVDGIDKDLIKYEAAEFNHLQKHFKEKREELMTQHKALQTKLEENVPLVKSLQGDQTRITQQHLQKMEKMEENLEAAKQRLEDGKQMQAQRRKEEKERHEKEMARIEELSEKAQKLIEEEITKLKEKKVEEEAEYAQKKTQIGKELAKNQSTGVAEAFATTAVSAAKVVTEVYATEEVILQKVQKDQAELEVTDQLTEGQMGYMAKSFKGMINEIRESIASQIRKEMLEMQKSRKEVEDEDDKTAKDKEEDGFQQVPPGRSGARRAKNPEAMAIDPAGQQKRGAAEEIAYEDAQAKKAQAIEEAPAAPAVAAEVAGGTK